MNSKGYKQLYLLRKQTENYHLHLKSDHPGLLKKGIPYSQIVRIKRICSINSEFSCNFKILQEKFTERCYDCLYLKSNLRRLNF